MTVTSITPFLWFDTQAEEAANFYVSLFANSRIIRVSRYGDFMAERAGQVMVVEAEIAGQHVLMMNGGPRYKLDEAFSFIANCEDQAEIDRLWAALCEEGAPNVCGWLRDRFGLTWQVNYARLPELMSSQERTNRVMAAMMTMAKIDIQALKDAAG
jgi:predicted 3-demethylubiquinone-9 3-methyltransferase (glyoxalase superfamily)